MIIIIIFREPVNLLNMTSITGNFSSFFGKLTAKKFKNISKVKYLNVN